MIVVIDNYDSFTFNLVQEFGHQGCEVRVFRNDRVDLDEIEALAPSHLVVSPGPGRPEGAGISIGVFQRFAHRIPMLGVCLGHQSLAVASDAKVGLADRLMHGKSSEVLHDGTGLFRGLPNPFPAGRYHSLIVPEAGLPDSLEVTARTAEGEIMALRIKKTCAIGVQFHPESVLTPDGPRLIQNFLEAPNEPC